MLHPAANAYIWEIKYAHNQCAQKLIFLIYVNILTAQIFHTHIITRTQIDRVPERRVRVRCDAAAFMVVTPLYGHRMLISLQ